MCIKLFDSINEGSEMHAAVTNIILYYIKFKIGKICLNLHIMGSVSLSLNGVSV